MQDIVIKSKVNYKPRLLVGQDLLTYYRGTEFRGVSRNGRNSWQIQLMINRQQFYLATVDNIILAALIYDITSIQSKGLQSKTNFSYTRAELLAIF